MPRGGARKGAGRKPNPNKTPKRVPPLLNSTVHAEPKRLDAGNVRATTADLMALVERLSAKRKSIPLDPRRMFAVARPMKGVIPEPDMIAMDECIQSSINYAVDGLAAGGFAENYATEGLVFLGYPYLSELAQRPEYRVMSETIADDATRRWIGFDVTGDATQQEDAIRQAEKDPEGEAERKADPDERMKRIKAAGKLDKIKKLQDDQDRLDVKTRSYEMCRGDGFFGRMHMFIDLGTEDPAELRMPIGNGRDYLSKAKVTKPIVALRSIEPVWTYPQAYNANNPLLGDWYNPQMWYVMGQEVHVTRLMKFIGHQVPDLLKPAYSFGGLSMTQMGKPYVDIWLQTRQSVADMIRSFSTMVLKTDLQTLLQNGSAADILMRMGMFNILRDNQGAFVVNKETEDFTNVSAPLAGLHELQAQAQEHMSAVSRIPLVKLTGISPSGLNATSEQEIEVYDDTIEAYQNRFLRPNLERVINFQQLSLFGEIDPEITWHFEGLRPMTEKEKGEKQKADAERDQYYVDMGAIAPEEVRRRIIDDPDLPYADLDPDDVPDLLDEEAGGLQIPGAHPDGGDGDNTKNVQGKEPSPFAQDDATWREEDHPRGPDGKFGSGGPSGSKPEKKTSGNASENGARPRADAAKLYQAPTKTAEQIVASFPGGSEAIERTREKLAALVPTDATVAEGGHKNPDGTYTDERQALHEKLVDDLFTPERIAAAKPNEGEKPVMVMLGGRGGSGKSWLTGKDGPVDGSKMFLIDADDIKSKLPGYEGWNASAYHEESSDILALVDARARALGINTVLDATMKSEASSALRMADYESAGYEVEGYYMYAAPEEAATRAMSRYSKGGTFSGRFVPPEIILGNVNNEKNFDKLSSGFRKWAVYDNNTLGQSPKLVSRSGDD